MSLCGRGPVTVWINVEKNIEKEGHQRSEATKGSGQHERKLKQRAKEALFGEIKNVGDICHNNHLWNPEHTRRMNEDLAVSESQHV